MFHPSPRSSELRSAGEAADPASREWWLLAAVFVLTLLLLSPTVASGQGANLLVGGGSLDNDCDLADGDWSDEVLGWLVSRSQTSGPNGGNGRVAVLDFESFSACGDAGGDCYLLSCLGAAAADHLCVNAQGNRGCLRADDSSTYDTILGYDALWFRGGDQNNYIDNWGGTLTEDAIHDLWSAGGTLGGTSAGAMMQSEVVSTGSAPSWEATANPYASTVSFETGFLSGANAVLAGTLVDSHFIGRARLGRLAVLVGRQYQDAARDLVGIGVDTETGFAVGSDRVGEVLGEGSVTILHPGSTTTTTLQSNRPAHVGHLETHFLTEGFRFDLDTRSVTGVPASARAASTSSRAYQSVTIEGASSSDVDKATWWVDGMDQQSSLWHGNLTLQTGSGGLGQGLVATNLEDDSAVRENRQGGPLWGLQEQAIAGLALFTDGYSGSSCNTVQVNTDESLTALASGCSDEQSAIAVDCCDLAWVDQSTWDGDGNGKARQSVALTPCVTTLFNSQVGPATYDASCGGSSCTVTEDPEQSCSDGVDNDCDGQVDGDDDDCAPTCEVTEMPEQSCSDGVDNDCDGFTDGDDSDCDDGGSCQASGTACTDDAQCCSFNCRGKPGSRTCK